MVHISLNFGDQLLGSIKVPQFVFFLNPFFIKVPQFVFFLNPFFFQKLSHTIMLIKF